MVREEFLVRGARLADGSRADIAVADGKIVGVGERADLAGATVIDADGLLALPGLVDLHTHLREPGYEQSETVLTGTRAAAAGGFTAVFAMANTSPVADTAGVVEQVLSLGEAAGYATVRPIGAVTVGLAGEREHGTMTSETRRVFGNLDLLLRAAGSSLDRLVQVHALIYDRIEYDVLNRAYREFVPNGPPARTVCRSAAAVGKKSIAKNRARSRCSDARRCSTAAT